MEAKYFDPKGWSYWYEAEIIEKNSDDVDETYKIKYCEDGVVDNAKPISLIR